MSDYLTIDENLRTAMRFFGEATGSGEVISLPGAVVNYSGLEYGVFNIAMLDSPVAQLGPGSDPSFETRVANIARYFRPRTQRWSLWLCDDLLDPVLRRHVKQILGDFGLRSITHPPGMIAHKLLPAAHALPSVEIHEVRDSAMRRAFAEITSVSFEIPFTIANAVYTQERAWQGAYQGYLAMAEGRPVSMMAIVEAAGVYGVYSLATQPMFRRLGYGEATMRAVLDKVITQGGPKPIVLQSTEQGYPLYRRMGFRDATRFSVYLTK
jgi:GNAT superfamily N-acetyltransferase